MIKVLRKIISILFMFSMTISLVITSYAEDSSIDNVVVESTTANESIGVAESTTEESSGDFDNLESFEDSFENEETVVVETEPEEDETIESTAQIDFIEETSSGQSINDYEKEALEKINEILESSDLENNETSEEEISNVLESVLDEVINKNIEESESVAEEISTEEILIVESTNDIATKREITEFQIENTTLLNDGIFGSGNHPSTALPSVVIHSTYDRYEIYTGENLGVVRIFDDNGNYYNGNTNVKVIRDMMDSSGNSPILLNLANNVQFFDFDSSNDNYVLLPNGFVEDLVARYSGNGYLNPQGINALDHIEVRFDFNNTDLGNYDLFEYGVLYYLSCYEGVLGEYYYYDPNTTNIDRAASFYVNNRIMDRTYNIVSEYYYKSPSGEQLSFKPAWVINNDNLLGANKEKYVKQWVNFPYFLIKTGEKYWNLRDSIEQSTYLSEYAEGYYEQYMTEQPYGNVSERLTILDNIYKTEEDLLNDNTNTTTFHPYVKSSAIQISGNYRPDTINEENKLRAGGVLPYDTYAVLNLNVTDHRAKSVQVYLNGEKLITNNNHGLYALTNGKCQLRIDSSKLFSDENSRNVVSFILLNEEGNYLVDQQNRIINSYISLIRNSSITRRTYIVSFNSNGGTVLPNINVEEGNRLSLPTNPTKPNFVFQGWFNDSNFQNRFDLNEYIVSAKTLYALWGQSIQTQSYSSGYSGGSGGSGGGGGGGGGGAGIPASTNTTNTLNPLMASTNANINANIPNTMTANAVRGNWFLSGDKWQFSDENGKDYKDKWVYIDLSNNPMSKNAYWYRFDENGNMQIGYYFTEDKVYYFNDGIKNKNDIGKMLVGWHWLPSLDGGYACYFFDTSDDNKGVLITDAVTRDGYRVDIFGRWCDNGQVQKRNYR